MSPVFVKNMRLPSGENATAPIRAFAGTVTLRCVPVDTERSMIPLPAGARCGALLRGLIRVPAMRSIGCDTSSIGGMLRREVITIVSRSGPIDTRGSGSASRMSTISLGGVR